MTPSHENVLFLLGTIDSQLNSLVNKVETEKKNKTHIEKLISEHQEYIAYVRDSLNYLTTRVPAPTNPDETDMYLSKYWNKISGETSTEKMLPETRNLGVIYSSVSANIPILQEERKVADVQIERVKQQKHFRAWVDNASKMRFRIIPEAMPNTLQEYSPKAMEQLVGFGTKVLWAPYKRYMTYHLYNVYKEEVQRNNLRNYRIQTYSETLVKAKMLVPMWIGRFNLEIQTHEKKLEDLQQTYATFDEDSDKRIREYSAQLEKDLINQFIPDTWNNWLGEVRSDFTSWHGVKSKDDVCTEEKEAFILANYHGKNRLNISFNPYTREYADRVCRDFFELLAVDGNSVGFAFPLMMHLDTLSFKFVADITSSNKDSRGQIDGFVQELVSSAISNLPAGKAKFIFSDPNNTGIFSNFRDVGKNESEGSKQCTYVVDVDGIRGEFERLSNEIGYTINNILKGTKTTLYQHNKERSFNSSPYVFLFLMDYPQNMTAQSLQALKNIVNNGPKCGIFTFIFKSTGVAMDMLRPDEKSIANEISYPDFVFSNGFLHDGKSSWLFMKPEIQTGEFDSFVKFYNEAIKDSQQLTVRIDELEPCTCSNGDYKIPIGKNLGGETEYMSFFGSCQDYLMTGATRIGKTNALHVIIYNTLKCVPDAELYLVDFKQGVEFAPYANLNHPGLKALAVESVPEFGYAVLKHIEEKIKAISELFISNSVKNWKEYFNVTGKVIPVTIVILDEFQHLFDGEDARECARIIEVITKEGGAFNVHVILATQSVSNIGGLTPAAKDNIFGRMVFYHSESEYNSMLWNDTHLALTLSSEVKGQMVFATGDKTSQRLLQWALAKPVSEVVEEIGYPVEQGRYSTKLLLSTVRENPYSVFNAIIKGKYKLDDPETCEITIGNEVNVFSGELRRALESGEVDRSDRYAEKSYLNLVKNPKENILFVGNNEYAAESCFQLSLYCTLARAITLNRKNSILLLAPDIASRLTSVAETFPDYISFCDQESDLSTIALDGVDFMFVFGFHNFRSMSYQPDSQLINAMNAESRHGIPSSIVSHQYVQRVNRSDGELLRQAIESNEIHVLAWHNNMQNLTAMFGGTTKIHDFLSCFNHKVGFRMNDKNDSVDFINSGVCAQLSEQAAVYVKMNKERVIRPYKAMDSRYCDELNAALKILGGETK